MIPAKVDIAPDVMKPAHDSLLFNRANPMSPIRWGVRKATGANVIGQCHGVSDMVRQIASRHGTTLDQLNDTVVSLNHLMWFTEVGDDDQDSKAME